MKKENYQAMITEELKDKLFAALRVYRERKITDEELVVVVCDSVLKAVENLVTNFVQNAIKKSENEIVGAVVPFEKKEEKE